MRALLVRVGADCTEAGGRWNGPVDSVTGAFAYVPIPEPEPVRPGLETPYARLAPAVGRLGVELPAALLDRPAHADPDFEHLTYGDRRERGRQIREKLGAGDLLVFYAGLRDVHHRGLVYGLIGLLTVDGIVRARDLPAERWAENAHTRRAEIGETDVVVHGTASASGRFDRCLPFAGYRSGAYRVHTELHRSLGRARRQGRLRPAERPAARADRPAAVPRMARRATRRAPAARQLVEA